MGLQQGPDSEPPKKQVKLNEKEDKGERLVCEYLIPNKNFRRCHLTRHATEKFCPQHKINLESDKGGRNRVPCPLDPAHTIWEDKLGKHIKICRARPKDFPQVAWCVENVNIALKKDDNRSGVSETSRSDTTQEQVVELVNKIYLADFRDSYPPQSIKESDGIRSRLDELGNKKHAIQQGSLIGNMVDEGFFDSECIVLEFGAGRGELSRYVARCRTADLIQKHEQSKYIMVDRAGPKLKFDTKIGKDFDGDIKDEKNSKYRPVVERIKMDIKDLNLAKYPMVQENPQLGVVAISKHLCGCATDLTLTCLSNVHDLVNVKGILIALCCRQLCTWETYSDEGRSYLEKNGIGPEQFKILAKLSSWAVCGKRSETDDKEFQKKELIGLKARAVIDYGRVLGVRAQGWHARVVKYVEKDVSLENHALIVTGKTSNGK